MQRAVRGHLLVPTNITKTSGSRDVPHALGKQELRQWEAITGISKILSLSPAQVGFSTSRGHEYHGQITRTYPRPRPPTPTHKHTHSHTHNWCKDTEKITPKDLLTGQGVCPEKWWEEVAENHSCQITAGAHWSRSCPPSASLIIVSLKTIGLWSHLKIITGHMKGNSDIHSHCHLFPVTFKHLPIFLTVLL